MSIATELAKLQTARNKIRTKLVALGLVAAAAKLDDCATAVDGISNQGAVSATVQEGDTYTIPAGYHNGSGTVSGVAGGGNYKLQSKTSRPQKRSRRSPRTAAITACPTLPSRRSPMRIRMCPPLRRARQTR